MPAIHIPSTLLPGRILACFRHHRCTYSIIIPLPMLAHSSGELTSLQIHFNQTKMFVTSIAPSSVLLEGIRTFSVHLSIGFYSYHRFPSLLLCQLSYLRSQHIILFICSERRVGLEPTLSKNG